MSRVFWRPLDAVAAMEALGLPKPQRDAFYEAVEERDGLTRGEAVKAMKDSEQDTDGRGAVMKRLEGGSAFSHADNSPIPPVGTAPATSYEPAPLPLIPYSDLKDVTRLGDGAFGDVYKGTYHGGEVAIKKAGVFAADASSIEKERRLLGSVRPHENVVRVMGVCVDAPDGAVRIVMELCPFGDLVSFTDALAKPLSLEFVLMVFLQAGHGVGHLHDTPPGICHGDIRRANFLVASTIPLRICLADFGLSHVLDTGGPSSTFTEIGPVAWRAPETFISIGGKQEVSVKTDVYMFGCFMLEVVTGREPLYWVSGGAMQAHVRLSNMDKSPLDLAEAAGKLDVSGVANDPGVRGTVDDVMALIRRCLSASPSERPNMAAVTSALEGMREKPRVVVQSYVPGYVQAPGAAVVAADPPVPPPPGSRGEAGAAGEEVAQRAAEEAAATAEAAREEAARKETEAKKAAAITAPPPAAPVLTDSAILGRVDATTVTAFQRVLTTEWLIAGVPTPSGTTFVTKLLYRGSRDGMNPAAFHTSCDSKGPTLTLIRSTNGFTFGAYAGESWFSPDEPVSVKARAFLFSVTGPHGNLTHFPPRIDGKGNVWCHTARGPCFGSSDEDGIVLRNWAWFSVASTAFDKKSRCGIPASFIDTLGQGDASFTGAATFTPEEIEVWVCVPLQTIPDSAILPVIAPGRLAAFLRELSVWLPRRTYTLLYRGSRDGMTAAAFHRLCDGKGPTLVLVRCDKGWVFGGYAGASWEPGNKYVGSGDAFLFSVTGPYTAAPVRFPVKAANAGKALYCHAGFGPMFNGGVCVTASSNSHADCYDVRGSVCNIGTYYEDSIGRGDKSLTGACNFTPVEVDIFAVSGV